jgi:hypothetical protein
MTREQQPATTAPLDWLPSDLREKGKHLKAHPAVVEFFPLGV